MASIQMQQMQSTPSSTSGLIQPKLSAAVPLTGATVEMPPGEPAYGTVIPNRIFVGGISRDTTETDLMRAFSAYGVVRSTKIIVDNDGYNKGYGFVTFDTEEEAQRLQMVGKCVILRNRRLNIAPAFKKQPSRPRLRPIVETNGTVYFTNQPAPPQPTTVSAIPYEQYAATGYGPTAGTAAAITDYGNASIADYGPAAIGDYGAAPMPAIYQHAPTGIQYQPIYQYYGVPMNVPAVWPQNYHQDQQVSNATAPIPQPAAWEFDAAGNGNWHSA